MQICNLLEANSSRTVQWKYILRRCTWKSTYCRSACSFSLNPKIRWNSLKVWEVYLSTRLLKKRRGRIKNIWLYCHAWSYHWIVKMIIFLSISKSSEIPVFDGEVPAQNLSLSLSSCQRQDISCGAQFFQQPSTLKLVKSIKTHSLLLTSFLLIKALFLSEFPADLTNVSFRAPQANILKLEPWNCKIMCCNIWERLKTSQLSSKENYLEISE